MLIKQNIRGVIAPKAQGSHRGEAESKPPRYEAKLQITGTYDLRRSEQVRWFRRVLDLKLTRI